MKKAPKVLHINPNEIKRNELHFQIQVNNRVHVQENKKAYKRCRDKKVAYDY